MVRSGRNSNLSETLCMSLLPASIKGSDQKQPRKGGDIIFPSVTTYRNGPERTKTDFYGYRNGLEWTSVGTETDWNGLQWVPKQT